VKEILTVKKHWSVLNTAVTHSVQDSNVHMYASLTPHHTTCDEASKCVTGEWQWLFLSTRKVAGWVAIIEE